MKLLYVSHVDTVVRMMLPHLDGARAAGFTVDVACCITRHGDDVRAHADTLWNLPFRRSPLHPANLLALSRLTRLIREQEYTIVHAHTPSGGVLGRLAATHARRPDGLPLRFYTAHGFHFHRQGSRLSNAIFRAIETYAGQRWSDAVLVINQEDYETARDKRVVPHERLFLTHGVGVSAEQFHSSTVPAAERERVRATVGATPDTVVLTLIGEMIPRKRHGDALAAFARIHQQYPNTVLVFAGDGPLMSTLQADVTRWGLSSAVHFLGFQRNIPAILSATDIFLFTSIQEGLPCSIQEALCMEVPVIATDVRGNQDLLAPEYGILVPPRNPDAMAAAACQLIEKGPEKRKAMGEAGRRRMVEAYNRERCVAEWLDIYAKLLAAQGLSFSPSTKQARL